MVSVGAESVDLRSVQWPACAATSPHPAAFPLVAIPPAGYYLLETVPSLGFLSSGEQMQYKRRTGSSPLGISPLLLLFFGKIKSYTISKDSFSIRK